MDANPNARDQREAVISSTGKELRPRGARVARVWHGTVAALAYAGVTMSVVQAMTLHDGPLASALHERRNIFAYFTTQSNLIVGTTSALLAVDADRDSTAFRVLYLDGLVMISMTATVFHAVLAKLFDLHGYRRVSNELVHTIVPAGAVLGWLALAPRGRLDRRVAELSLAYPVAWLVATLARGAAVHWYPYPFLDVDRLGYRRVLVNVAGLTGAYCLLAAGTCTVDHLLARAARKDPAPESSCGPQGEPGPRG